MVKPQPLQPVEKRAPKRIDAQKQRSSKNSTQESMDPPVPKSPRAFLARDLVHIGKEQQEPGFKFTIMTYNVLAQSLVSRTQFPTSGSILRWNARFKALTKEILHYNPTVLCLQEVDKSNMVQWVRFLEKKGYNYQLHNVDTKKHGLVLAYKRLILEHVQCLTGDYNSTVLPGVPNQIRFNEFLVAALRFNSDLCEKSPYLRSRGLIVGTTHLYWHPEGCYERARQGYILMKEIASFGKKLTEKESPGFKYHLFMAGDFNSEPHDAPYLLLTTKGLADNGRMKERLNTSFILNTGLSKMTSQSLEMGSSSEAVSSLIAMHLDLPYRAVSLYSLGYYSVKGIPFSPCNEPEFTNWRESFRATLDYIFLITDCKDRPSFLHVDSPEILQRDTSLKLSGLLRLPTTEEMAVEGLPRSGWSPSDHFCIMAEIEIQSLWSV